MKKLAPLFLCFLITSAHASTYFGKVGPFYGDSYSEQSEHVKKCKSGFTKLSLSASANGKLAMPRFNYRDIAVELKSGNILNVVSSEENKAHKEVALKIPANDCVTKVTINAISNGFNPGRTDQIDIEIWASK